MGGVDVGVIAHSFVGATVSGSVCFTKNGKKKKIVDKFFTNHFSQITTWVKES